MDLVPLFLSFCRGDGWDKSRFTLGVEDGPRDTQLKSLVTNRFVRSVLIDKDYEGSFIEIGRQMWTVYTKVQRLK